MAIAQFDTIPQRGFAYLVMRKCGCSSIKQAISQLRDDHPATTSAEIHAPRESTLAPKQMSNGEDWFTFTIVRDPIVRFLSFYSNKVLDQNLAGNDTLKRRREYGYYPNMTLDDAISVLIDTTYKTEPHVQLQHEMIDQVGFELDYIGSIEKFSESISAIERLSGIRLPVQHINQAIHKPLFIDEAQFDVLAEYFLEDLRRFGYPENFQDWYDANVRDRMEKFQREGFIFEDQARLHRYQVRRNPNRYTIDLFWKVEASQTCKRVVRIIQRDESGRELIWHMPPEFGLYSQADEQGLLHEKISVPLAKIPSEVDPAELFFELYFAAEDTARPRLVNYHNHQNMLMFALRETVLKKAKS